jgi:hypothetical protein
MLTRMYSLLSNSFDDDDDDDDTWYNNLMTFVVIIIIFFFTSFCFFIVFLHILCSYAVENLSLHSLRKRSHHPDATSFLQVYCYLISYSSLLENVSARVPTRYVRDFSTFILCPWIKYCPPRCTYSTIVAGKPFSIFRIKAVSLNRILLIDILKVPFFYYVHFYS